jgi:hypothetical protein
VALWTMAEALHLKGLRLHEFRARPCRIVRGYNVEFRRQDYPQMGVY